MRAIGPIRALSVFVAEPVQQDRNLLLVRSIPTVGCAKRRHHDSGARPIRVAGAPYELRLVSERTSGG